MKKNSRDIILRTARELFLKYGYTGVSIRKIAASARLTTGAIYFHFKNKDEIYREICFEAADLLKEKVIEGLSGKKRPDSKLLSNHDSYLQFYNDHNDYYNILMEFKSAYSTNNDIKSAIHSRLNEITGLAEETIRLGIAKEQFREIDPVKLSIFLAALSEGMLQYKKLGLLDFMDFSDREFRGFMADVVGNGISKKPEK